MDVDPATRRSRIIEDIYDEFQSTDLPDETDCDREDKDFKTSDVVLARKSMESLSLYINCLLLTASVLMLELS
jgi:hypothetical protein